MIASVIFAVLLGLVRCQTVVNGSAFSVYYDTSDPTTIYGPTTLEYPNTNVNYKLPYDPDTGNWRAGDAGYYFFHMSAGTRDDHRVNVSIAGAAYPCHLVRNSTHHQTDVINRDIIMYMADQSICSETLAEQTTITNMFGKPTTWAGFDISGLSSRVITFYAVSDTYQIPEGAPTTLVFETEMLDIDGVTADNYNTGTGHFTAPVAGPYFFIFTTGVEAYAEHRSHFLLNGASRMSGIHHGVGINTGVDTLSKSMIQYMNAGDTMEIQLVNGQATNNHTTLLSFGGFLINPIPPTPTHVWFVNTNTSHYSFEDPLIFENVELNMGGLYNQTTNMVEITTSGYYYMSCYSGLSPSSRYYTDMPLMRDTGEGTEEILSLRRVNNYLINVDIFGRSALVHLRAGDKVYLRLVDSDTFSYSNSDILTTFSGFLLLEKSDP